MYHDPKARSMSAFDTRLNVIGHSIGVPNEEQLRNGVPPSVEIALKIGLSLPFSTGPGEQPVTTAAGSVRYEIGRDAAIEFFKKGLEAAEGLPVAADIQIASDLKGV